MSTLTAGSTSLLAEFTEIESDKRHTNRPKLLRAIELSRRQKATLVIAKLDRRSAQWAGATNAQRDLSGYAGTVRKTMVEVREPVLDPYRSAFVNRSPSDSM